jgi:hypothetical protein
MENICIPMHLDAFALSPDCCQGASRIAPYTQPNYTSLRLDSHLIRNDILDHVDFHNTSPATKNPRLADIGISPPNNLKPNRMGVHLHWSLPNLYRTAVASGRQQTSASDTKDPTQPVFRRIPTRWLVVRHLKNFQEANVLPEFQCWVVESDAVRKIKTIPDNVDLESDVSPFVSYEGNSSDLNVLKAQTEVFIGQKFPLPWSEDGSRKHLTGGLTVMTSSNPLFPDYALHNTNALSIIDNFAYRSSPSDTQDSYLQKAVCDYFVIGWHADAADDPLMVLPAAAGDLSNTLDSRLSKLKLELSPAGSTKLGASQDPTRCLSHGAIYNVSYNSAQKPRSLADEGAAKFTSDIKMEPLSIGTTPLDAILTFLEAHKSDVDGIFGQGTQDIAKDILELAQLLYASADEYDARVQAQDLLAHQSYAKANGGSYWTYAKGADPTDASKPNSGKPKIPSQAEIDLLNRVSDAQISLDVCSRKLKSLQWDLFAEWWKYTSEFIPDKEPDKTNRQNQYRAEVDRIKGLIAGQNQAGGLVKQIQSLQDTISQLQSQVECKNSANEAFRLRTDPTICIAGLASGWPLTVVGQNLQVHLDSEFTGDNAAVSKIFGQRANPIPSVHGLQATAVRILTQCLQQSNTSNGAVGAPTIEGFQAWGARNPFVPLFIEWESMYYNIDFDKWDVEVRPSPVGHANSQVRYVPTSSLNTQPAIQKDFRILSGRINVLAQPLFDLETIVLAVLDSGSPDISLTPAEIQAIRDKIKQIQFVAAPLNGLTNHLLTRCEGAHVKPNVRVQGQKVVPLEAAVQSSQDIHIDLATLGLVDSESALTPYGSLFAFDQQQYPNPPFKAVTHGQMLFTKINIIDKFGQAICLPTPRPRRRIEVQPPNSNIYPCLSDNLAPDVVNGQLNTVFPTQNPVVAGQWPLCEYVQLTPSINQPARINASFLTRDTISPGHYSAWREASDYEQPIWGWIIINYADNGLQFFQADGTFYTEIRRSAHISPKWLPYGIPSSNSTSAASAQLDELIAQLSPQNDPDGTFLQSFFNMINGAIQDMSFPPSSYSAYANAIVGKPLALTNVGWSLELAEPAIRPQNALGRVTQDPQADLEAYAFKLKIGDVERSFDGVAGYFASHNTQTDSSTDWSKLFTYWVPEPHPKVQELVPDAFLPLHPYYINPEPASLSGTTITEARARKYAVTTVLMDPYNAIHGYSPALPTKALTLSLWTVQSAFDKMHAFFHLGPNLLIDDVPATYDKALAAGVVPAGTTPTAAASTAAAAANTTTSQPAAAGTGGGTTTDPTTGQPQTPPAPPPTPVVTLPVSGKKGTWTWLQPYPRPDTAASGGGSGGGGGGGGGGGSGVSSGTETTMNPQYAQINVQEDLGNVKFAAAPYTFVEGFLQLMGSLGQDPRDTGSSGN